MLNVGDLAMEASQNLGLLLEQLKSPKVKSLSTSMIMVFVTRFISCPLVFHYLFLCITSCEKISLLLLPCYYLFVLSVEKSHATMIFIQNEFLLFLSPNLCIIFVTLLT